MSYKKVKSARDFKAMALQVSYIDLMALPLKSVDTIRFLELQHQT
jgi:hypothetical protein